jgi:glucuronate isomerase
MYHWCHLELKNYFGYEGILSGDTAEEVWNLCNTKLQQPEFSARNLILRSHVVMVGTTDDPCSDLKWHKLLAQSDFQVKVCPSFRPDPALNCHKAGFAHYIAKLSEASGIAIQCAEDVAKALTQRIDYFNDCGCRASDHGLDYVMHRVGTMDEIEAVFQKAMVGQVPTVEETEIYQTYLLLHCGREYARHGWAMQLHFSCFRNPNSRMFHKLGADCGFDCIAVTDSSAALHRLMDAWDSAGQLPKTIVYSLNPADDQWLDTLLGAYQGTEVPGKIQHGSAWWFNDNRTGMVNQMTSLANLGVLGNFIGMLTDSRSFLSYARHEYFRRILCNLLGTWVENGEYPADMDTLGELVADICYRNAVRYFNL